MFAEQLRSEFDEIARLSGENHGDDRYDEFLASLIPARATSILEVGCGLGRLSKRLSNPQRLVTGIDLSPEMIARARFLENNSAPLKFHCADFLQMDFEPQSFDSVVSVAALHHMPLQTAVSRMMELVKPGGTLVIQDLRSDENIADRLVSLLAGCLNCLRRLMKTGHLFPQKALRQAWLKHGANETYLTMTEVRELAMGLCPAARTYKHWFWRYTIVWQKGC